MFDRTEPGALMFDQRGGRVRSGAQRSGGRGFIVFALITLAKAFAVQLFAI